MHLYDELQEVKAPPYSHSDGLRVYIDYDVGGGRTKRLYIGYYTDKEQGMMHVNDNYRHYCADEWKKWYGKDNLPHYQYNVGMYAMTLTVTHRNQLYPILHQAFGPLYGNALLDFAMYSIMERSNVAYRFMAAMEHEVIFSKDRMDDSQLSVMFESKITIDMIRKFRIEWLKQCRSSGAAKAWISIDGSNSDCECTNSELTAKTKNKSGLNKDAVSYMYAVNADDGLPLTYLDYYGDMVDSKAVQEMCELLQSADIEVEGVILDRGFLTHDVMVLLKRLKLDYVIKLKSDTYATTQMLMKYGDDICWNLRYMIAKNGLFGISGGPHRLFKEYSDEAYISLYFDAKNGTERKLTLADKLFDAAAKAMENPDETGKPQIPSEYQKYLAVETDTPLTHDTDPGREDDKDKSSEERSTTGCWGEPGKESHETKNTAVPIQTALNGSEEETNQERIPQLSGENTDSKANDQNPENMICHAAAAEQMPNVSWRIVPTELCNKVLYRKGFDGIASSKDMGAARCNEVYHLRDSSEKQYMIMKSMLGSDVFRVHSTEAIHVKGVICFIASVIRQEICKACKQLGLDLSIMLPQIERPSLAFLANGTYKYISNMKEDTKALFEQTGCTEEDFQTIAGDVNQRENAEQGHGVSQYHRSPEEIRQAHRLGRAARKAKESQVEGCDLSTCEDDESIRPSRAPGRPKGSKNKKTLEREAANRAAGIEPIEKRGRGRPKGSKKRKTLEREARGECNTPKRRRGRPAGSRDSKPRRRRTAAEIEAARERSRE